MPVTILVGTQWGDEGKGRFVDWLSQEADIVARYSGGDNAGHTVAVGDQVYKLHLIPSGILHPNTVSVMGNGMVINPLNLLSEMQRLRDQGVTISPDTLRISDRAHIITPGHIALDAAQEAQRGTEALGTTLRGIGPAYLDKTGRQGLRMGQMLDLEAYADALTAHIAWSKQALEQSGQSSIDFVLQQHLEAAQQLRPFITDTTAFFAEQLKLGARVLCEGAQGTMLDVDHGTYPFVTSSSPTSGGALTGLGIGPTQVDTVFGVAKAFSTRVGGGPMPTELSGDIADRLRGTGEKYWDEFGTTTGRPRRCGWLDAVVLRYAVTVNGCTELALTKLDVLSGLDMLQIAVAYDISGERRLYPPGTILDFERANVIYETLPGWSEDISDARTAADLPHNARDYIRRVSELVGVPIQVVSVGPERDQLVRL